MVDACEDGPAVETFVEFSLAGAPGFADDDATAVVEGVVAAVFSLDEASMPEISSPSSETP